MIDLRLGDCLEVMKTIEVGSVDAVITDPPYGDKHDGDYTRFTGGTAKQNVHHAIKNDDHPFDPVHLLDYPNVVLFGANRFSDRLPCGSWLIWDKRTPNGSKNVMSDAEPAWWSKGHGIYIFSHTWDGFNRASERGTAYHPTQKPVALMEWVIKKLRLEPGMTVLDPYMGSGPVGVACVRAGINYIGCEIDPVHFATAEWRIEAAQAQPALMAGVGE